MIDPRPLEDIAHGVPPVAVSTTSTLVNRTGSWKYIRPVFRDLVAPCNQGCPVGIDIEGYMNLLREDRVAEACDLLLRENPLPAVTGRVCYHPCEVACNRASFDQAVAIHAVERMLGDFALEHPVPAQPQRMSGHEVAVVGAGPAGLSCSYHLARLGHRVTLFEAEPEAGGILRYGIPEYRLPRAVLAGEIARIRGLGVHMRFGVRVGSDPSWSVLEAYRAVFVATGAHRGRSLGIEGEGTPGVVPGLEFLKQVNRGRRPAIGRRVVVVGGGNTAIDCARTALRLGAEPLVVYRRSRAEMPAHDEEVEAAAGEGVRFEFLAAPVAVRAEPGDDDHPLAAIATMFNAPLEPRTALRLAGLECERMRLGEPDAGGRRRPVPIEGSGFFLPADTVLAALGEEAELDFLPADARGSALTVPVDALGRTGRAMVFAGGDIVDQPRTVAYAIGSGKRAALGIDRALRLGADGNGGPGIQDLRYGARGNVSMTRWRGDDPVRRSEPTNQVVAFERLNPSHFVPTPRLDERQLAIGARRRSFAEANRGLAPRDAIAEAGRCFNCGVCNGCELCLIFCPDLAITRRADAPGFEIAYDYCKGCGVCSAECPRGAITMTREGL